MALLGAVVDCVGGWNNVLNMIPARDPAEDRNFSEADRAWFRGWIAWTNEHKDLLRHTRPILGPPALGRIDGTTAILDNHGYVFLFNPNARRASTEFVLDESIGLSARGAFVLKEVLPLAGRLIGKPGAGRWTTGDQVSITFDGGTATVLEIAPAEPPPGPVLFNAPGQATVTGSTLSIADARGEVGTTTELFVQLPPGAAVTSATVNGQPAAIVSTSEAGVTVRASFDGVAFRQYQPIFEPEAGFKGGSLSGQFTIPQRIVDQLTARRKAWPIPWTPDDFRTPWLVPERLLLFVQIAEPSRRVGCAVDDRRPAGGAAQGLLGGAVRGPDVRRLLRRSLAARTRAALSFRARTAGAQARAAAGRLLRERRDRIHRPHRRRWPLTAAFGMGPRGRQRMTCPSQRSTSV